MRTLLALCIVLTLTVTNTMAQSDYSNLWKEVEQLETQGLSTSGAKKVDELFRKAVADKNQEQKIKALIYQLRYASVLKDSSLDYGLERLEKETAEAQGPAKAILYSMKAEILWTYLQSNSYAIMSRLDVVNDQSKDIRTWSAQRLNTAITQAYEASLAQPELLKKAPISAYSQIIDKGQNANGLQPTVYDLLAYRAINYYRSGYNTMNKPANQFELTDPAAFAPATEFAVHAFTSPDTSSLQLKALLLYQDLIAFHLKDEQKTALAEADVQRLKYVKEISVAAEKNELYNSALTHMLQTYRSSPAYATVAAMKAESLLEDLPLGFGDIKPVTPTQHQQVAQVLEIVEEALKAYPQAAGAAECQNIKNRVLFPEMELTTEKVNVPGQALRILSKYRNTGTAYFKLIPVTESQWSKALTEMKWYDETELFRKIITNTPAVRSWNQPLPAGTDHFGHAAEVKVDALQPGMYLLLMSTNNTFSTNDNLMVGKFFDVSDIAFLTSDSTLYALDRTTGQPLPGARLDISTMTPNPDTKQLDKIFSGSADNNGKITVAYSTKRYADKWMLWTYKNQQLIVSNINDYSFRIRGGYVQPVKEDNRRLFFFTDRGLYRPGQVLYFKGIVLEKAGNNDSRVLAGFKTTVHLHDANNEIVDSVVVTANDFGAFSGKFTLPLGRLTGTYRLTDAITNASTNFNVEEYKRPKFEVKFDPVKIAYRVGDTVTANGKAIAFAGNNVDGAKVSYRVVRVPRFPYPWLGYKYYIPRGNSQEIVSGTTVTDAQGKFNIQFTAIPDKTIDTALAPYFVYQVSATVTDINGETRSQTQDINAGYNTLLLSVQVDAWNKVKITTTNLNGEFEAANLQLRLQPLKPVERLLRTRYWEEPDQFIYSAEEYARLFPLDVYKDEDQLEKRPLLPAVFEKQLSSVKEGITDPGYSKLKPGFYQLEVTATPAKGKPVVQKEIFEVTEPGKETMPYPMYSWYYTENKTYKPGQQAVVKVASAKDAYVLQEEMRGEQPTVITAFKLTGTDTRKYDLTQKDLGGAQVNFNWIRDNRFQHIAIMFPVATDDKSLKVELASHRDKLAPGEKEKWSVKVSGENAQQAEASFLAGMYDASLDALRPFSWNLPVLGVTNYMRGGLSMSDNSGSESASIISYLEDKNKYTNVVYPSLNWFGWGLDLSGASRLYMRGAGAPAAAMMVKESRSAKRAAPAGGIAKMEMADAAAGTGTVPPPPAPEAPANSSANAPAKARTNFNETAFFFPDLRTDANGNVSFEFTMPEALTKWKFQGLAHTKAAAFGLLTQEIVTQKTLMVQPFAPRFMREGDKINFTAKISNLADSPLIGQAHLELLDAATMQPVDGWFQNIFPVQHFTAKAGQSTQVSFPLQVPNGFGSTLIYRITAQAGNFSDGEENALPVLTNRMLVTESVPLSMIGDGTKTVNFKKLEESDASETLQQHAVTVEYTSNPAWYAVQALPYLMEFPYDCAEQVFNRYYANVLGGWIVSQRPAIKEIFEKWKTANTAALMSNLEKNQDLKSLLLQQTPWVLDAKNENQQKHNIAKLFDAANIRTGADVALQQLAAKQNHNGSFPWFAGLSDDRFITQYIVAGIGRLNGLTGNTNGQANTIAEKAIKYLDAKLVADYKRMISQKIKPENQHVYGIDIQYLYARSFFDVAKSAEVTTLHNYYLKLAKKDWLKFTLYEKAMAALLFHRLHDNVTATAIVKSLKENAIVSPEMGMYWKSNTGGYFWSQAPVETQAMLIDAFTTVAGDKQSAAQMKTWLLKNKQTNNWNTTKATADGCYAMLIGGDNWLAAVPSVDIKLGAVDISSASSDAEAGTGYIRKQFNGKDVKPAMGKIEVAVKGSKGQPSWGAVYWQYFEQLDKITAAQTPLTIEKQLYKEVNAANGPVLTQLNDGNQLHVGDKLKARIVLRVDRDMEYVHLKDMRAAAFEPLNVLSTAKYQGGMGYYESTKDASTDFFFNALPKGTWVFEYPMYVTHEGTFSNGVATVQCMYAPEFNAHSEGINVKVVEK
ncbi:MG2 domain-containing protein [Chitinophaga jiangningensis]|uniref:MG2 domain-containing protein n=1 Tax=Chitinophaga jiangningensis TaxID=1419482 RepID=A0A1M7H8A7_9BACT|nr:MG2 domain-containing protein [Chitinophaga jiangningensis]SHM24740.1 MG2 domain-containing protein [Chitinophaga jiangningensis]